MLRVRTVLSIVLFGVFVAMGIGVAITQHEQLKWLVLLPFVGAYIALPRNVVLSEMNDEVRAVFHKAQLYLSYLRVGYFLIALTLLFVVPRFV